MKNLLHLSFGLNLLLLTIMLAHSSHTPNLSRTPRSDVGLPISQNSGVGTPTPWSQIDSSDPAKLMANLRAIGCPEQTIRDIIVLHVARAYRDRLLATQMEVYRNWNYTKNLPRDYWKNSNAQWSRLRNEMTAELEGLLGEDAGKAKMAVLGWPYNPDSGDSLSMEQRRQIRDLDARYRELKRDLDTGGMMGALDAEDRAKLRALEAQKRAELANILSPPQLQEYLYRNSTAADYVRNNMPAAKSEEEFRQMVKVALDMGMGNDPVSYHQRYGLPGYDDPSAKDAEARKTAFDEKIKQTLGEDRIAEQKAEEQARLEQEKKAQEQRDIERERSRIIEAAAPLGISAEDASRLCDRLRELIPSMQTKFNELEKTITGTQEEKNEKMKAAMQAELERIAVEALGEKGRALARKLMPSD